MPQTEWSNDGTPWILLAIYVVLAGESVASSSPLTDLTTALSWIPVLIGVYLTVRPYYANPGE